MSALYQAATAALRELELQAAREEEVEERRAEFTAGGLRRYARAAWPWLEPRSPFVSNWHIDVICEHLELAFEREIPRLLINIQPGVLKTTLVSIIAPSWRWTTHPEERFLTASFAMGRALDPAVKSRALINSPWYRANWGDVFRLTGDQNEKSRYTNDKTGHRIATSVGSGVTGEHGDVLILDDPNAADEATSEADRSRAINWWGGTWATRLSDPKAGVKVVIQQRIHENDVTGHILAEEGRLEDGGEWVHLCLPAEYEPGHPFVCPREITLPNGRVAPGDPRKTEGELLSPVWMPQETLEKLKRTMGAQKAAGQLQQRPAPLDGAILKRHWWRFYRPDELPEVQHLVSYWDTTFKDKTTSDYVVGLVVGCAGANRYLLRRWRGQWGLVEAQEQIRASAAWATLHYPGLPHAINVEASANGPDIVAALRNTIAGIVSRPVKGDKVQRAFAVTPQLEAGQVLLPGFPDPSGGGPDQARTPAWALELVEECASFPNGAHDDQVDAVTGALIRAGLAGPPDAGEPGGPRRGRDGGADPELSYGMAL